VNIVVTGGSVGLVLALLGQQLSEQKELQYLWILLGVIAVMLVELFLVMLQVHRADQAIEPVERRVAVNTDTTKSKTD
jgi:hypothetical protein